MLNHKLKTPQASSGIVRSARQQWAHLNMPCASWVSAMSTRNTQHTRASSKLCVVMSAYAWLICEQRYRYQIIIHLKQNHFTFEHCTQQEDRRVDIVQKHVN